MHRMLGSLLVTATVGCGAVDSTEKPAISDAAVAIDSTGMDTAPLGTQVNPAGSCVELRTAAKPTGVYWLKDPAGGDAFEGYCDQDRNGGGWALVYRSVRTGGSTTQFWQITYAHRLDLKGAPIAGSNFYAPTLYRSGREYMDTLTDLKDTTAVAMVATCTGFDTSTMKFTDPKLTVGSAGVFDSHFKGGWSSSDFDGDTHATVNCATEYSGIAQHYSTCWVYSLGSDADMPRLDEGVGPHVANSLLTSLSLSIQPSGGDYSRVNVIERYARW